MATQEINNQVLEFPLKPEADSEEEVAEWLEAFDQVVESEGTTRGCDLLEALIERARESGVEIPVQLNTPYVNTIPVSEEVPYPGDRLLERRIKSLIRWNAMAMVHRQNKKDPGIGGHISTYSSLATLLEVGFNHFFHAKYGDQPGDFIYFQGHSSPGVYARAFLEGRLSEEQVRNFRHELRGAPGLSSYPHPWLMPNFWRFPTVSMGLGPLNAIYQARFMRYLENREIIAQTPRKIWAFVGDGETDEPESMGSLTLASREKLDNLIFVINCNLQRLDGPVRGNGKIINELEAAFRGAGWNVIKVLWGSDWDKLFARDKSGVLIKRMEEAVDGEYQSYKAKGGEYIRREFFGKYPELLAMVSDMSDDELHRLARGGHDPQKVYNAYKRAVEHRGGPTVILAHTVKGYGLGSAEARNATHQEKKLADKALTAFRSRFDIPIPEEAARDGSLYRPPDDSPELAYLRQRRKELGGYMPSRVVSDLQFEAPPLSDFAESLAGSKGRAVSTTMGFVSMLRQVLKHPVIGKLVVPIIPDEGRTFGMESIIRQVGIYASQGQLYKPHDQDMLLYYREEKNGQILEEGITEAGSMASFTAAGTAYANYKVPMVPVFHLLLDVWVPAYRRLDLGVCRRSRQGLPDGRYCRQNNPFGRRLATSGWTQPGAFQHRSHLPQLRSGVRVRDCRHRARWHAAHVSGGRGPLLLHHSVQRRLCDAGNARRGGRRNSSWDLQIPIVGPRPGNGPSVRQRVHLERGVARSEYSLREIRRALRCMERDQLQRAAARRTCH